MQGSLAQMRPVLMMIVVALLGMVPAARASGIGSDVQRPLATVVVGGSAFYAVPHTACVAKPVRSSCQG